MHHQILYEIRGFKGKHQKMTRVSMEKCVSDVLLCDAMLRTEKLK